MQWGRKIHDHLCAYFLRMGGRGSCRAVPQSSRRLRESVALPVLRIVGRVLNPPHPRPLPSGRGDRSAAWLLAALLVCAAVTAPTRARAAQWSDPIQLSSPVRFAWFPDVAADAAGGVHVVWTSAFGTRPNGYDRVEYCAVGARGCEQTVDLARRAAVDGLYVTRPSIAADDLGRLHLLWRRKELICYSAASIVPDVLDRTWLPQRRLGDGRHTNLAVDRDGTLHALWSQGMFRDDDAVCFGCSDIMYSRSTDGGVAWSVPINVSQTPLGSEKPQIAFGSDGSVYVAWEEGGDFYAGKGQAQSSMLAVSRDDGRTWEAPVTFTDPGDTPQSIAVGVDNTGAVVVVWQQVVGDGIFYQVSPDGARSWSAPARVGNLQRRATTNDLDDFDIASDAARTLHLVLAARDPEHPGQHGVYHLEWDGESWSAAEPLFATRGLPEWPRIAVGLGNQLHVVWFERNAGFESQSEQGLYGVWYARGTSAAPAIAPVVWPLPPRAGLSAAAIGRVAQVVLAFATVATVVLLTRRWEG